MLFLFFNFSLVKHWNWVRLPLNESFILFVKVKFYAKTLCESEIDLRCTCIEKKTIFGSSLKLHHLDQPHTVVTNMRWDAAYVEP